MTVKLGTEDPSADVVKEKLLGKVPAARKAKLASYIAGLYKLFRELHFAYLEINPLVMPNDTTVMCLDLAAHIQRKHSSAKWMGKQVLHSSSRSSTLRAESG